MTTDRFIERRKTPRTSTTATTTRNTAPARIHRERDFGVGYGSSSGYGSNRHYADSRSTAFFRCR